MPKKYDIVTVVDNETGEEQTGKIVQYTEELIVIKQYKHFDAKKVHFKDVDRDV